MACDNNDAGLIFSSSGKKVVCTKSVKSTIVDHALRFFANLKFNIGFRLDVAQFLFSSYIAGNVADCVVHILVYALIVT